MDNITIRKAIMKRCPEVYFIAKPMRKHGKIFVPMLAKIPGIKRPVQLFGDMPDTALVSHKEMLTTLVSELSDEIKKLRTGEKALEDNPLEDWPPLSIEGQTVFDRDGIQYYGATGDAQPAK